MACLYTWHEKIYLQSQIKCSRTIQFLKTAYWLHSLMIKASYQQVLRKSLHWAIHFVHVVQSQEKISSLLNPKGVSLCFWAFLVLLLHLYHSIQQWLFQQWRWLALHFQRFLHPPAKIKMYPNSFVFCGTYITSIFISNPETERSSRMF